MILIQNALLLGVMSYKILDIRYMTNDSKLRFYVGVLGLSMTSIIVIEFFLSLYGILATFLYFDTCILELKIGIDHGLQLANDMSVFIGVLAHFMAIFSFFWCFWLHFSVILALLWDVSYNFLLFFPIYRSTLMN